MPSFKPFSVFLQVFVLFVCCVALSQQKIVRDTVKGISYANFVENDNRRLNAVILQPALHVKNLTECQGECLNNNECVSGNYGKNSNEHQQHDCELLAANKFTSSPLMSVDNTFQHFSVVVSEFSVNLISSREHVLKLF